MAETKNERQTRLCDELREFVQSIATIAVQAQDEIGNDAMFDLLDLIEGDVKQARQRAEALTKG